VFKATIDLTSITGLGTTYARNLTRWRLYRAPSTATRLDQFDLVDEIGTPTATSTTVGFDNGMYIPGARDAYVLTETDEDGKLVFFAQLAGIFKRPLPNKLLSNVFGHMLFGTPILRKRTGLLKHVYVRNLLPADR
jgi:hypothetical protein